MNAPGATPVSVEIRFCVPDDQEHLLPRRRRTPRTVDSALPLPQKGDLVYLSSSSAWAVALVIHEWKSQMDLRVEFWLEHVGSGRHARPPGFALTQ